MKRVAPFLADLLLVFACFYPQSVRPQDSVGYVGDSLESVYYVAWTVHQFFRDPLHIFDANILYPLHHPLAFTGTLLLPPLLVSPVVWISGNPVLAYNVAVVLACLLAAVGARRLARDLGADAVGAWAAGALYAFHTYQIHESSRLNIIFHGFLPFALRELILYLKTGERRRAWKAAGFMLLQGFSANYHLLYGALLFGVVIVGVFLARPRQTAGRMPGLLLAAGVAAICYSPMIWPYLEASRTYGHERALPPAMGIEHYFTTLPGNIVWGKLGPEIRSQQRGPHFVGFVSLVLAIAALLGCVRRRADDEGTILPTRVWVPAAAALALLFAALSLGRNVVLLGRYLAPGPYRLLYSFVPGFRLVRIPERLGLLAMLFVALLVARALTRLRARGWGVLATTLALVVPLEHVSPREEVTRVPVGRTVPEVYRWLARSPARAIAEVPIRGEGLVREETTEMYFSVYHWKPLIHGYTAYPPLLTRLLRRLAAQFPQEVALQAFQRIGVDTVVVHYGRDVGMDLFRQVPGRGAEKEERFRALLRPAGLDLFGSLPDAVASGRIVREARFQGESAHLYEATMDEVYRIAPVPARPSAPFPGGSRLREASWRYRAKVGEPALAADDRMDTKWESIESLAGDEFFEVDFGHPVAVTGVVLPLRWDTPFPTRFRLDGRQGADWVPLARFGEAQALQLLDRVLSDPRSAAIGFTLDGRELQGFRLAVEAGGTSFDGWAIPEIEVRVR